MTNSSFQRHSVDDLRVHAGHEIAARHAPVHLSPCENHSHLHSWMRPTPLLSVVMVTLLLGCATQSGVVPEESPPQESETKVTIAARAAYWIPTLDGHFLVTKASAPGTGTRINVQDDLGMDDASAWSAGLDVFLNDHRFQFSFDRAPFHGSTTVDQPFVYHGVTFESGTPVSSELTF